MVLAEVAEHCAAIKAEIERAIIGKGDAIDLALIGLLADGHVLIQDVPGVAKTLLARSMANATGLRWARIQFTPDLMPADVTGSAVFDPPSGTFEFRAGPIFAQLVLGDEINRAPPKTQAALLEAMGEGQVTADGVTHELPRPFLVFATQNPVEYEGTYPLPEAQLDRFLLRLRVGYPDEADESAMLRRRADRGTDQPVLAAVVGPETVLAMQATVERVHVSDTVIAYQTALVRATRSNPQVTVGASPRGSLALLRASRAHAALRGHEFVTPDDVKAVAVAALAHRLVLRPELWVRGSDGSEIVQACLSEVRAPAAADGLA